MSSSERPQRLQDSIMFDHWGGPRGGRENGPVHRPRSSRCLRRCRHTKNGYAALNTAVAVFCSVRRRSC